MTSSPQGHPGFFYYSHPGPRAGISNYGTLSHFEILKRVQNDFKEEIRHQVLCIL